MSHFNYEICELRRRPVRSRCIEFIIRPNFLTSNSRYDSERSAEFNATLRLVCFLNIRQFRV
ncbi:hypothetical protein [Leptospira noguchii]|uniref:hypothetical protein n=1 Tax=Leptospira noguchii TaxID=28182 RepID=UPI0018DEEA00|nr:hypothetical protein [Leptospira noguchii]